jgi:hypothetical protein
VQPAAERATKLHEPIHKAVDGGTPESKSQEPISALLQSFVPQAIDARGHDVLQRNIAKKPAGDFHDSGKAKVFHECL